MEKDGSFYRLMAWLFLTVKLEGLYSRLWNPINYFTIAGLGVAINYLVLFLLYGLLGWPVYLVNILAIGSAALWNWSQSVGPFSYLWGFRKQENSKKWASR